MKTKTFIQLFFLGVLSVVLSACVPKATEKKAACGTNQSFNTITRSCDSVVQPRTKPVGTLGSGSLSQETAKTFTLSYTDTNNNSALSCRVFSPSANIELLSPSLLNGAVFSKADDLYNTTMDLYNSMPLGAQKTSASAHTTPLADALLKARSSFTYATVQTQLGLFRSEAQAILSDASPLRAAFSAVDFYSALAITRTAALDTVTTNITNNCECSGGVCTTVVASKMRENGAAAFNYTITDQDGEGDTKAVNLTITANSNSAGYLKPAVGSSYISTFNESATSTASTYPFSLPTARDYFGTASFSYTFSGTKNGSNYGLTTNGKVYGCMDLFGSTGATDTSCIYVPNTGDSNYTGAAATSATATVQGLLFTAVAKGTFGNNYTVQLIDATSTTLLTQAENFGLVSSLYTDSFVRVVDNAIQIYYGPNTTPADIVNLINNDSKAKTLVVASDVGATTFTTMGAATSLAGGTDTFDNVSFTVSNGYASSTNSASVGFTMNAIDDAPYMNYAVSTPSNSALEDSGPIAIDLSGTYADVDSTITACDVHVAGVDPNVDATVEASFLANFTVNSCTCVAGSCTASVTPNANVSSTTAYNFYYRATSLGQNSDYRMATVSVTPVNDAPILGAVGAQVILENSTAAPSSGSTSVTVDPGGGGFESTQKLSLALSSNNTTLLPNTSCTNYVPGAGTPVGSQTPTAIGQYFFDTTAKACYVSTGTTNTSWALYPSLTAFPNCAYDYFGQGAPAVTPSAAGKYYLDTTNNKCYKSSSNTLASWALDYTLTSFFIAYVPVANQSGAATITMTLSDDGGTSNGGADSASGTFGLTVTSVDDPPYFLTSITKVDTNEGGMVVAGPFKVDEDQGSSADEDAQALSITSITSDNTSVLPTSAITIFYDLNDNGVEDSGESRAVAATMENAAGDDGKLHNFYLKLNPVAGISGNANLTLTVNDGNVAASHYVSTTFSLIVHPIAALHGGWANITATGIKTDKNGAPAAAADVQCSYNKSTDLNACDGHQNCSGTTSPNASIIPDAANVLYYDSAAKTCYRATAAADKFSWVEFKTSCPVTRQTGICSSENCIAGSAPVPTAVGQYYFNTSSNLCYISTGTLAGDWTAYTPSKVTLTWNSFNVSGSGADATVTVYGWNVYRREKGYDYDYVSGFLKLNSTDTMTISDATVKTFTDKTAVAGKVYYYLVRPVDSSTRHLTISTPEVYSEVRVLAPTENYAFVHRWMVNQEICNSMHMTTSTTNKVDPTHNYRCPYSGPGESATYPGYYDIEKDMMVDISESGCPYSAAPKCTANGCVGIGDPTSLGVSGMVADDIYYDRSAGTCYAYDGAAWNDYNTAVLTAANVAKTNTALNAPLTNISKAQASAICTMRLTTAPLANLIAPPAHPSLPTKKEFIAYSASPYGMSDALITDLEQGFSLNVQSRCNSTNANGIDTAFSDSSIPSTSYIFSLPGTASSTIRSIYTGSVPFGVDASTESCSSRYGVQDVYGNVAEWVKDGMDCSDPTKICTANAGTDLGDYDFSGSSDFYAFDLSTGPFNDSNVATVGPDAADSYLTEWDFRDELFSAGKFNFPLGMPINVDIGSVGAFNGKAFLNYLLDIGPTNGITTNQLHEDGIIVNGTAVNAGATKKGSFAQGGSYLSGNRAGRYTSELVPDADLRSDVGFRCYIPIDKTNYPADAGRHTYSY